MNNAAARKIQEMFRRKLIFTNNQKAYKLSKSVITAKIVSFKLPTNWRAVFASEPKGFTEIVGYRGQSPVIRWADGRWLGEPTGITKLVAKYRAVTIVLSDKGFDVLGAGNYEQALLAIVKSGWAPKILLKAPPKYTKIDGMFHVNRRFELKELAYWLRTLPDSILESVRASGKETGIGGVPAVVLKLKKPKWTYQFFENGTVLWSGIKDPKDVEMPKELVKQFLSPTYGIAPAFVFNLKQRVMLTRPRRTENATGRLAERYKLAGTWNKLRPAPEGYYIRPGTDGKPRLYPWVLFEERGGATYGPFGGNITSMMVPIRQLNLKAVAPKVLEAFKKAGKPIPAATAKVFANAGHPLKEPNENTKKETALKNRRAPSWNATKPGFYVRPGPGKQPYWFKVPEGLASGRKTVIKTYADAGRNIPKAVREIFKIGNNVKTAGAGGGAHVVKMGLNGILRINNRQATRLTKAELLAIARNLNIAQATNKMAPGALIALIQRKTGEHRPNRTFDVFVNGMYYKILNNGRVARTTSEGIQTQRAWATLGAEERNKIAKAVIPSQYHAEYNNMPLANRFEAVRTFAMGNRMTKAEAKAKTNANAAARAKAVAAKAKANAEAATKANAEANNFELELTYAMYLSQNLGNLYKKGNEKAFINAYKKLPKGARGKPLKPAVNKAYRAFIKNLKTRRANEGPRNAYRKAIPVPNWMPANKVNAYKTLVTNLAFQKPKPKVANFKAAVKTWLNTQVPQSPARAARQVENAITGEKRIIPAYVPKKRTSPVIPKPPAVPKKAPKEPKVRNPVYSPMSLNMITNTMNRYKLNYRRQKGWTVQEFVNAIKKKNKSVNESALRALWNAEVVRKARTTGAAGRVKR